MPNHKLNLSMFSFHIKRKRSQDSETILIDEFLDNSYPESGNPFNAFAASFVTSLSTLYKTSDNTLGAVINWHEIDASNRLLDITIDGGTTGIKQLLIYSNPREGSKMINTEDTVTLPFFVRFWMPSTRTGYIFLQSYTDSTIRRLILSVLKDVLTRTNYCLVQQRINKTTTRSRMQQFLDRSVPIAISIINKPSEYDPIRLSSSSATLTIKGDLPSADQLTPSNIKNFASETHGINLSEDGNYQYKITYQITNERGDKEERTIALEADLGDIKVIPNIIIPEECINEDNHPIKEELQRICNEEIEQICSEDL